MALAPLGTPTKAAKPTANTFILPRLAAKFITPIQCNSQDGSGVSWRINVPRFPTITSGNCFSGYATWDGSRHPKYLRQPHLLKSSAKAWIERSIIDGHLCYRITDQGLAAKKMPI